MKRNIIIFLALGFAAAACSKTAPDRTAEMKAVQFDSWIKYHKEIEPGYLWKETPLGSYILTESAGTGKDVKDYDYVSINFTTSSLSGNIDATTDSLTAKQLGLFSRQLYFGPQVKAYRDTSFFVGIRELLVDMKVGGKKKAVVPSWLQTTRQCANPAEYRQYTTEETNVIYDIEVTDCFNDVNGWQLDRIKEYVKVNCPKADTLVNGLYFCRLKEPSSEGPMPEDTTIYINYTGRFLDGHLFDTNIKRIAMDTWREDFNPIAAYSPSIIKWGSDFSKITMGASSSGVIPGFARTIFNMHPHEKAVGIFWSDLGYGAAGSSAGGVFSIPPYCPLVFEIEVVDKP